MPQVSAHIPPSVFTQYGELKNDRSAAVCLGNFDGMHRGHQSIMRSLLDEAKRQGLVSIVFTFEQHPMKVLRPEAFGGLLFTSEEKKEFLLRLPVDFILLQEFSKDFSRISADHFAANILSERLKAKCVVVGKNFRFGHKAEGGVEMLRRQKNYSVFEVPAAEYAGRTVSSSWIRELVSQGDVEKASDFLGYPYFITGVTAHGAGRGKGLGFPTANLSFQKECLPRAGVYATIVEDRETKKYFCAATNLGNKPTFGNSPLSLESHLIHFDGDLYGRELRIFFLKFIRSERKFDGIEELKKQIASDLQNCQRYFQSLQFMQTEDRTKPVTLVAPDALTQSFQPYKIFSQF